jgi:hypothetical protein
MTLHVSWTLINRWADDDSVPSPTNCGCVLERKDAAQEGVSRETDHISTDFGG